MSGNPAGRPRKGDSLADLIRAEGNAPSDSEPEKARKVKMAQRMWNYAAEAHGDPHIAIKAADWIAKHGYSPLSDLTLDDDALVPTKVIIELHPGR